MIDFHVHSCISDGTCSPKEIIELAAANNLHAIALTDHDSIEGVAEAAREAKRLNINFLPGIEISAKYEGGRLLHILGLGIDPKNKKFLEGYEGVIKAREDSLPPILKSIEKQGIRIDYEILKERATRPYMDRHDIHRYFIAEGLCSHVQEVWDQYLDPIPYGAEELMDAQKAIEIIKEAGGLSFLAHYPKRIGLGGYTKSEMEKHIKRLMDMGLDGIEQYYPSFSEQEQEFVDFLVEKYDLLSSGGSDFHGGNRVGISLGIGDGNLNIPYSVFENIQKMLNTR